MADATLAIRPVGPDVALRSAGPGPGVDSTLGWAAEVAMLGAGQAIRRRAGRVLAALLPGFDLATSVQRPEQAGIHFGPSPTLGAWADRATAEVDHLLRHHDVGRQFHTMRAGHLTQARGVFSARSIESAGAQLRLGAAAAMAVATDLTIRLTAVDQQLPTVAALCGHLEATYGVRATVNAYITAGSTPGTVAHFDDHDVIVVQVSGQKGWRVGRPDCPTRPGESADRPLGVIDWEGVLSPGDVLCLPRGRIHEAVPCGGGSVHLTFALRRPAYADLAADLGLVVVDGLGEDAWLADLPAAPEAGPSVAATVADLLRSAGADPAKAAGVEGQLATYRARLTARPTAPFLRLVDATRRPLDWSYRWAAATEPLIVEGLESSIAVAGWVIQSGLEPLAAIVPAVGAESWVPDPDLDPEAVRLISALIELDVLDPVAPVRRP